MIARRSEEKAFIDAARDGKIEVVDRLFECVKTKRTWDKALHAAARNVDVELFNKIAPHASLRGYQRALHSLMRHHKSTCCHKHILVCKAQGRMIHK